MDRWGSKLGFAYLMILVLNTMFGGASVLVMMSCQVAAFARDGGLAYNDKLAHIDPRSNMPLWSSVMITAGGILMLSFGFSPIASNIIYSLAVIAVMVLYVIPMFFRIFHGGRWIPGPWNLGKFSVPMHAWSILSVTYMVIMECFPPSKSWTAETLNYNWVVLLVAIFISIVFWYTIGTNNYLGPNQEALAAWRAHQLDRQDSGPHSIDGISVDHKATTYLAVSKK